MTDSSSSSTVHTNVPDVGSTRTDNVPVQVTTIQLNKENYLRWSAAITMGIAGRCIAYVNGRKHMYGQKKRKVRVYQLMRDVYSLREGTCSVAKFYAALKSKWEDLDYHSDLTWKCPQDQMQYMTKEWENRTPHIQVLDKDKEEVLDKDKEDISAEAHELGKKEEELEKDVPPMVTEEEGTRMFGQVYSRRKTCDDKMVDNEEATLNPNPTSSLDDPNTYRRLDVKHSQTQKLHWHRCKIAGYCLLWGNFSADWMPNIGNRQTELPPVQHPALTCRRKVLQASRPNRWWVFSYESRRMRSVGVFHRDFAGSHRFFPRHQEGCRQEGCRCHTLVAATAVQTPSPYITGEKPAPVKNDPQWATWTLEDNQGDSSVASFYAALKTKWEELDYHTNDDWKNASDQALYWEKEWMDRTFIFLGGLRDEFESIRSQLLNCDEIPGIEEVYARVEAEEQRSQIMHIDSSHGSSPTAFVSRTAVSEERDSQMKGSSVVEQSRDHLFGQVYSRKEKNVMEVVDVTNLNLARTPCDPSPMNEDLPIALRKGTRSEIHENMNCARCNTNYMQVEDGMKSVKEYVFERRVAEDECHTDQQDVDIGGFAKVARCLEKLKNSEKQLGRPLEEDLASWGHHSSSTTVPDVILQASAGEEAEQRVVVGRWRWQRRKRRRKCRQWGCRSRACADPAKWSWCLVVRCGMPDGGLVEMVCGGQAVAVWRLEESRRGEDWKSG
ncbi:CHROMATIN REMODELING 25 protein [Nymphaea thermarum]|nr:CHROMATIN REMODELING 25 protein [Nymphaea thermarum]